MEGQNPQLWDLPPKKPEPPPPPLLHPPPPPPPPPPTPFPPLPSSSSPSSSSSSSSSSSNPVVAFGASIPSRFKGSPSSPVSMTKSSFAALFRCVNTPEQFTSQKCYSYMEEQLRHIVSRLAPLKGQRKKEKWEEKMRKKEKWEEKMRKKARKGSNSQHHGKGSSRSRDAARWSSFLNGISSLT